jgi:hypothetical protein
MSLTEQIIETIEAGRKFDLSDNRIDRMLHEIGCSQIIHKDDMLIVYYLDEREEHFIVIGNLGSGHFCVYAPGSCRNRSFSIAKSTGVVRLRESRTRHLSAASSAARSEVVSSPKQSEATRLADKRVDRRLTAAAWHGSGVFAQ